MKKETYSFTKGLVKGVTSFLVFAIPFFITSFPEIANLSIGAVAVIVLNAIKFHAKQNLNI